jgi:uncharacterized surface protein with fasciclin (FAS1) repeats
MKKNIYKIIRNQILIISSLAGIIGLKSCFEEEFVNPRTVDKPMISTYLAKIDSFSEFSELLKITGYEAFLKTYGTYTCFVPTNEAFAKFKVRKGKDWRDLSIDEKKNIVKYVVIKDTLSSKTFSDGKLSKPNMYNHYLLGGSTIIDGVSKYRLNKFATITKTDIRVENGIIHVIDEVLEPPASSIAELIENIEGFSIFVQALKETGWYNTLKEVSQDTSKMVWYTVLGESDETLKKAGINSYDDLKARFSNTGDPTSPDDSLNLFVRYHTIKGLYFAADLPMQTSHDTYVQNEVIISSATGDSIFLNRQLIADVLELGVSVNRFKSNYFAANGVFNSLNDLLIIKSRKPYPIYWDVCEQPEIMKLPGFRTQNPSGYEYLFPYPTSEDGTVTWTKMKWKGGGNARIGYKVCDSIIGPSGITYPYESKRFVYNDVLFLEMRTEVSSAVHWIEFTTPFVPRGEYKIWLCHGMKSDQRDVRTMTCDVYIDDSLMPTQFYNWCVLDTSVKEEDYEFLGYKRYIYDDMPCPRYNGLLPSDSKGNFVDGSVYVGRLLGKVKFATHGTHRIKLVALYQPGAPGDLRIDMIHIIPADMDQIWPKFNWKGEKIYKPK